MEAIVEQILPVRTNGVCHYSGLNAISVFLRAARRLVSHFVANEIAYLLRGGAPTLIVADRVRWRVPVLLTITTKPQFVPNNRSKRDLVLMCLQACQNARRRNRAHWYGDNVCRAKIYPLFPRFHPFRKQEAE